MYVEYNCASQIQFNVYVWKRKKNVKKEKKKKSGFLPLQFPTFFLLNNRNDKKRIFTNLKSIIAINTQIQALPGHNHGEKPRNTIRNLAAAAAAGPHDIVEHKHACATQERAFFGSL